jgi:hypothetical protein
MNSKLSRINFTAFLIFSCAVSVFSNSAKINDNQYAINHHDHERLNLYAPIVPSGQGMRNFFERIYNDPKYAEDVLPNDFSHFIQCLEYAQKRYKTRTHAQHVCKLFRNKMKDCLYINAASFALMLDNLIPILNNYMHDAEEQALTCWQKTIEKILYDAFMKNFASFKAQPLAFFNTLSGSIADTLYDQEQLLNDITIAEFRNAITAFLDLGMNKLIWHPEDSMQTWKLLNNICDNVHQLSGNNIISENELQELFDTLVKRYCFFLDLVSEDLPLSFYDSMKKELAAHSFELLDCGELESCIESKRQRLSRAIIQAEARVRTANLTA